MKRLLTLVLCAAALPPTRVVPPEQWARDFQKRHARLPLERQARPALFTPAFDAALRKEWAYAKGEVGRLDYDRLGAGRHIAEPIAFEAESVQEDAAVVAMRYAFVLDPGAAPGKHAVHLALKKEGARCWRLDDFITPRGDSLMRLFAGDPEQSEAGPADKASGALTSPAW